MRAVLVDEALPEIGDLGVGLERRHGDRQLVKPIIANMPANPGRTGTRCVAPLAQLLGQRDEIE